MNLTNKFFLLLALSAFSSSTALASAIGSLDMVSAQGVLIGWAASDSHPSHTIPVHVYIDGPAGEGGTYIGSATASGSRPDVQAAMGYGASSGFSFPIPGKHFDGRVHAYYIYAIDPAGYHNPLLYNAPKSFAKAAPPSTVKMGRCEVIAQTCPRQKVWDYMLVSNDRYNGSGTNVDACLRRLGDYRGWCGKGPRIQVQAIDTNGKLIRSVESAGYTIRRVRGGPTQDGSASFTPVVSFHINNYGGVADGKTDSSTALQKALDAAIASKKPAQVVLGSGTYRLNCVKNDSPCFKINKASKLVLRGAGASQTKLLIANPRAGGFAITSSENIYFHRFSIDYAKVPAAQGTVQSVSGASMHVDFDAGFPLPNDTSVFIPGKPGLSFGMVFEPGAYNIREPNAMFGLSFQALGGSSFLVNNIPAGSEFRAGDKFVYPVRNYQPTFNFKQSSHIGLADIVQNAAPDVALQFLDNTGSIVINNYRLVRASGRVMTASGGAIWTRDNSARFVVKNSTFEGMGDDVLDWMSQGRKAGQALPAGTTSANSQSTGGYTFARDWAAPGSLFVDNIMGTYRGAVRVHSAGAIIQNNRFASQSNGLFVVAADIQSTWAEGPGLGEAAHLPMPHFIDNSAGGAWVRLISPDWRSTSAAPE